MAKANAKILIVDDEAATRWLVRLVLGSSYEIIEAGSVSEALECVGKNDVDLVLLDVMMPGMNGFEMCRTMKAASRDYLPVILVTSLAEQADKVRGLEFGADDFLIKPVDQKELILRTRAFLRLREQDVLIRKQIEEMRRLQALKEDLVALLVHDLRSPLSGVVAHLQLLGEEVTGESKSDVQYALRAADTTLQRLDETLQIRLIEEGQLVIRPSEVLVQTIIADVLAEASGIARRKNVTLRPDVGPGLTFSLDGSLMRRSVENLVSNAIKYAPMGSAVGVSAKLLSDSLAIEVSDEGPGVPDSLKSSMFTKFGSIEAKKGSQRTGFGLGLYLVKLVADRHGGSIAIEDRQGGGSVFRLVLRAPSV